MSKVINKKLHPYYKTGIYGWIGEEVDDNDYIICPICGDVLGMNYWDYSAENDGDDKCPKCKQELDYGEIYDFEDTLYFRQLLEIKESRLADLEAKLAESEKNVEFYQERYSNATTSAYGADLIAKNIQSRLEEEIRELKQQLEEKDTRIAELEDKDWYEGTIKQLEEQNGKLIQERDNANLQLAEKDAEIEQWKSMAERSSSVLDRFNYCGESIIYNTTREQDKISFAVEQLEKVKEHADIDFRKNCYINAVELDKFIDNQIEELKKVDEVV